MGKFFMLQRKKWSIEKFGVLPKLRELTIDGGWKPRPPTPHLACLPHCMQQSHLKEGMCGAHFRRAGLFPLHCSILLEGRFGGEWPISSCPAESFPTPSGPYVDGGKGVRKTQLGHIDVEWGTDVEILAWLIAQRVRSRRWSEDKGVLLLVPGRWYVMIREESEGCRSSEWICKYAVKSKWC